MVLDEAFMVLASRFEYGVMCSNFLAQVEAILKFLMEVLSVLDWCFELSPGQL